MSFSIHQFSNGFISLSQNKEGEWVSGGFDSEIANESHLVPKEIKRAVNTQSKGGWRGLGINDAYPPKPGDIALIARDLGRYCVLAVANIQKDDKGGRKFIAYRYFWLDKRQLSNQQDVDGIATLFWYWQQKGKPQLNIGELVTNPSSYRTSWDNLQQFYPRFRPEQNPQIFQRIKPLLEAIRQGNQPLLYEATQIQDTLSPEEVHYLAIQYSIVNQRSISWAWNVRRLETTENLNVIYCADAEAYNWFDRQLTYIPPAPTLLPTQFGQQTGSPATPIPHSANTTGTSPNRHRAVKVDGRSKSISLWERYINFSIDGESLMRTYLHIISGVFSAIAGWSLSQFIWLDIAQKINENKSALDAMPLPPPDLVLLPIIAASIAVAMVIAEILASNPTKHRLNRKEIFSINPARNRSQTLPHFWLAVFCGLGAGLLSAALAWWLYGTNVSGQWVRGICWVVVGLFVGLGEGWSWRSRSMEGETQRANGRLAKTIILGGLAGLMAAFIVETVRIRLKTLGLAGYEDIVSFAILGASLGLGLSLAAAPSYAVALRAGAGFEMTEAMRAIWNDDNADLPRIMDSDRLQLLTEDDPETPLEENLSILLPYYTRKDEEIIIGSDAAIADIYLPGIPQRCAALSARNRKVKIKCLQPGTVQVNRTLMRARSQQELRHGQILTFLRTDKSKKPYCFCFYDTLYDPQS